MSKVKRLGITGLVLVGMLAVGVNGHTGFKGLVEVSATEERVFDDSRDVEGVILAMSEGFDEALNRGIFPSVLVANALWESNYGRSVHYTESNNPFVLRAKMGGIAEFSTKGEGISAYLDLITGDYYTSKGVAAANTPEEQLYALQDAGWGIGSSEYTERLLSIIEGFNLTQYDVR